jgi:GLPGLI family protein
MIHIARLRAILLLLCALFTTAALRGQSLNGTITYERTSHWIRIMESLPYLSEAEKERTRLTWGRDEGYTLPMTLTFDEQTSLYTYGPEKAKEQSGWSWRREEFFILRDFETQMRRDIIEMPDRVYLVEDEMPSIKWKILTEIKEVAGYVCMSAESRDTVKNQRIVAWFTTEIPLPYGPELYHGLPGIILELDINDGAVSIVARDVQLGSLARRPVLPKRKRLKTLTSAEYNQRIANHIKESIQIQRNPYWSIRY